MRKEPTFALLTLTVLFLTIFQPSFGRSARAIEPAITPYPIIEEQDPIAFGLLTRSNIWADDPAKAVQIYDRLVSRSRNKDAISDVRDKYFGIAVPINARSENREPMRNERAFNEYEVFVNIDPRGSIPATIYKEKLKTEDGYVQGNQLRDALALFTAADNIEKLDKKTLKLLEARLYGGAPTDPKLGYSEAQKDSSVKVLKAVGDIIMGATNALERGRVVKD